MSNRDRGKRAERAASKALGGKRVGTMSGEDIHFDAPFSAEVKSREKCVVEKWLKQAEKNAPEGKTPLLIVHIHGSRHENDMVVLRMKDYIQWYGKPGCSVCKDPSLAGAF